MNNTTRVCDKQNQAHFLNEGYKPYLQSGAWTVRNDVRDETGVRVEDLNLLNLDKTYLYENHEGFLEFWESLLAKK